MTRGCASAGTLAAARKVVAANGWRGLYRGNATNVLRSAPQKALDFFAFDVFKASATQEQQQQQRRPQSSETSQNLVL